MRVRILVMTESEYRDLVKLLGMTASSRSIHLAALGQEVLDNVTDAVVAANISPLPKNGAQHAD